MSTQPTLFAGITKSGAIYGGDQEQYRYWITRRWDAEAGIAVWVCLNPSTATEFELDPTLRRIKGFTQHWGYGGFDVVNIFGLRSPQPSVLMSHADPVGLDNDRWILETVTGGAVKRVIAAWGTFGHLKSRGERVAAMLKENGIEVWTLGTTQEGWPKHPLYVRGDTELVRFI